MKIDSSVKKIIENAILLAKESGINVCTTTHLFAAILITDCFARDILNKVRIRSEDIQDYLPKDVINDSISYTPLLQEVMNEAEYIATKLNSNKISSDHYLLALLIFKSNVIDDILTKHNTTKNTILYDIISYYPDSTYFKDLLGIETDKGEFVQGIENLCANMIEEASKGKYDLAIGREVETNDIIKILTRKKKNNVCLVGDAGVGKTAIVENLAIKILNNEVPSILNNKIIYSLNMGSLIAGTKYRGEFEAKIQEIISIASENDNIILFIDEIHTIIGTGAGEGSLDVANILKPALARGDVQVIGATTYEEYTKFIEKDKALERRFTKLVVNEPSLEDTINILRKIKISYENHHKVNISDDLLNLCVQLSDRYVRDRYFPDKAIDVLDEACAKAKINNVTINNKPKKSKVGEKEFINFVISDKNLNEDNKYNYTNLEKSHILEVVSHYCNIDSKKLESNNKNYSEISTNIKNIILGQDLPIDKVIKAIKLSSLEFTNQGRPTSFMFCGTSGVGKTSLARELANQLYHNKNNFITVDMSEYMHSHSVSRLVGSPPGYIGFDKKGQLTEEIRKYPYSVILFDEVEKAHPDVTNILLRILDEGVITDSTGRDIDFKNTIIIFTTNTGTNLIANKGSLGFSGNQGDENTNQIILSEIKRQFKPEFLNRIGDIIVFNRLNDECIKNIIALKLNEFSEKLKITYNINLSYDSDVIKYISNKIENKHLGARPIERAINDSVKNELADYIIVYGTNISNINITVEDNKLVLKRS